MIIDKIKILLLGILGVLLLLSVCIHIDYATNTTINNINNTPMEIHNKSITVVNSTKLNDLNSTGSYFVANHNDKIYTVKEKPRKKRKKSLPTISMWAKPSVRSRYSYTWHKFTWIDYCPNCGHYKALLKNPKRVPENEYTCRYCDSDYCAVTGKEKYSCSRVYLRRA